MTRVGLVTVTSELLRRAIGLPEAVRVENVWPSPGTAGEEYTVKVSGDRHAIPFQDEGGPTRKCDSNELFRQRSAAEVDVIRPGASVGLSVPGDSFIPATICSVQLDSNLRAIYEVAWWSGRQRCTAWLCRSEFDCVDSVPVAKIGFAE